MLGMSLVGGALGSLILLPFIQGNGENVFEAVWIAVGGTVVALVLVSVVLVKPPKKTGDEPKAPPTPKVAQRILFVVIVAAALDAAGDEGTRIARSTVWLLRPEFHLLLHDCYTTVSRLFRGCFANCSIPCAAATVPDHAQRLL